MIALASVGWDLGAAGTRLEMELTDEATRHKAGVKVVVLLTDRREVLTGQAGQVVANRYRIARIGHESVDLEDVGTGQSRRIPLKGN